MIEAAHGARLPPPVHFPMRPASRFALLMLLPAALAFAQAELPKDLKAEFQNLWKGSDFVAAERTLEAGFKSSPQEALALAKSLIENGNDFARPLGASLYAKHASTIELAALAAKLNRTTFPDERRLLVRALGDYAEQDPQAVIDAAGGFVGDTDLYVASAAILSLADTGKPEAIGFFIDRLVDIPAETNSATNGDRGVLSRAAAGALESLTTQRFKSIGEAKTWWAKTKGKDQPDPKPAKDAKPVTGSYGGQKYYLTDRFRVFYRIGSGFDPPADGDLSFDAMTVTLDKAPEAAEKVLTPLVGRPHIPTLRLFLCDPQQFNAKAGKASFAGMTSGNEIILKVDVPKSLPLTLWHEYIHAIHDSNFANQPRWISEGLAMSYTLSAKKPMQREAMSKDMQTIIARGGFSEMLNWNSGGSGDSKESARYATAHLCIDYLRFSAGHGATDTRLAFVMGRLARRQGARQAIEGVFGMSVKDLDAGLRTLAAEVAGR